jgi:hypothetical protein
MNSLEEKDSEINSVDDINDLFVSDEEAYELELYNQIILEQESMDYIYKIEFYNNYNKKINKLYYYNAVDTRWIFDSNQKFNVFYIKVSKTSLEYQSAKCNSKTLDELSSKIINQKKKKYYNEV